jgi:hypothetical protein
MKSCFLLAALVVGLLGTGIFWLVSRSGDMVAAVGKVLEMPAHITVENIERVHGELIDRVEVAANESDTVFGMLAALEKQQWPDELLAIEVESVGGESDSLVFHSKTSGRISKIINGIGYGTLRYRGGNKIEFVAIQPAGNWPYLEDITILLKDRLPRNPEAVDASEDARDGAGG